MQYTTAIACVTILGASGGTYRRDSASAKRTTYATLRTPCAHLNNLSRTRLLAIAILRQFGQQALGRAGPTGDSASSRLRRVTQKARGLERVQPQ